MCGASCRIPIMQGLPAERSTFSFCMCPGEVQLPSAVLQLICVSCLQENRPPHAQNLFMLFSCGWRCVQVAK